MGFSEGMSPADYAAVTRNNNNDGFGGGNGWWWIIVLFLFAGWGRGGYGTEGGGISENYTLISDMGQLERKIDGVYSGICDSTFALNNAITNGFAAAQNTMTQGFAGLNTGMVQQGYEGRIATQAVGTQLAQCCCDLRQQAQNAYLIDQLKRVQQGPTWLQILMARLIMPYRVAAAVDVAAKEVHQYGRVCA